MTIEQLTEYLKAECEKCSTVPKYMDAFERMANMPVEADYPIALDELMYEYGTYDWFTGKGKEFEFHLSRTIPDGGDEYLSVNLSLYYEPADWNAPFNGAESSDLTMRSHSEFIAGIRSTEIFKLLIGRKIKHAEVYHDGT